MFINSNKSNYEINENKHDLYEPDGEHLSQRQVFRPTAEITSHTHSQLNSTHQNWIPSFFQRKWRYIVSIFQLWKRKKMETHNLQIHTNDLSSFSVLLILFSFQSHYNLALISFSVVINFTLQINFPYLHFGYGNIYNEERFRFLFLGFHLLLINIEILTQLWIEHKMMLCAKINFNLNARNFMKTHDSLSSIQNKRK